MVAAIASNGSFDLFASHREPAWHGLGTIFQQEVTDYKEMLALAGLNDWDVREADLLIDGMPDADWAVGAKGIVATIGGTDRVLGVTGNRYTIVQHEDAFSFLQSLHEGARWETAGAIKGGRVVFGSMAFDRDFVLDPSGVADVVRSYLLVHTSHDGSTGVGYGVTPTRVVCQNTLNVALGNVKQSGKIRHTMKADERMKADAEMWRTANTYMDKFSAQAQTLFQTKVTDGAYQMVLDDLFPKPEADVKGAQAKWENNRDKFSQAWNGAPNAGIKGTAWGVFNALTEANQWGRKTQNTTNGAENFAMAGAGFDLPTNAFRQKALDISLAFV